MGKPAAKKGDKIVSATPGDIHIVMVPSPGGPIPTPLPHPCKSDLKMKLAKKVNVQGKPGAMKGSKSKHMPPHIPTPPGVSFQKPPKNEAEVFTASTNVNYEGRGAAMLGDTGLMCSDPTDTPVGVLVVPPGTVYVGGGMSGLEAARANAKIAALEAAAAKCHEWINTHMPPGADREEAHRRVCEATGHPVDVATGKVFTGVTISQLIGRIPIRLAIDYSTARAHEDGPFGHGWRHQLERHLLVTDEFVAHRNQHGHFAPFEPIGPGEEARNPSDGLTLSHHGHYLTVRDAEGLEDVFILPDGYQKGGMLPLAGVRDAFRNCVRLKYDDQRLASITDSAGREVLLTYTDANRVMQVLLKDDPQVAAQPVMTCRYDRSGDLIAVGDPLRHERRFAYDHHLLVQETDRNGFSFYFAYDEERRCVLTWGDGGNLYRRMSYDPERRHTHVIDSYGGQTLHRLSSIGTVEDTVDPLGREWSKTYDGQGLLLSDTDPAGNSWTFAYDDAGRLTERSDPLGDSCELTYDEEGRISLARYSQGAEIAVRYDPGTHQPLAKQIGDGGPEQRYVRNRHGDLEEVQQDGATILRFGHDARGLIEEIDAGRFHIVRRFDAAGRVVEAIDGGGGSSVFAYDERGSVATEQRTGQAPQRLGYDREANLARLEQGDRIIEYDYGILDVPTAVRGNGVRQDLSFDHDTENRLTRIVNGRGANHRFFYDLGGRLVRCQFPDNTVAHCHYDDADRAKMVIDRGGRALHLTYDDAGNCLREDYGGGEVVERVFENGTELDAHATASVRCETERNDAGAPIGESFTFEDGTRLSMIRDDEGFLTFSDDPLRATVVGGIDGQSLGATCNAWPGAMRYHSREGTIRVGYPSRLIETIRLDSAGRRREQVLTAPDRQTINRRRLLYDESGRLVGIDDELRGEQRFVFDTAGRLREVHGPGGECLQRYDYDASENLSRDGETWRFDVADRLVERPGHRYRYDALGNCVEHWDHRHGRTRYAYDARNQLIQVERPETPRTTYGYDARGRRVRKQVGDAETLFLWNGDLLVAERSSAGWRRTYLYHRNSHHLIGWVDRDDAETRCYFVHSDHLGRPQEVTDEKGRLVWAVEYDAFGAIRRHLAAEVECPIRSAGQYADAESGLYYNRSRYFDPATARYMGEDSAGLAGGANPYAYCPNPLADVDFYGEQFIRNEYYDPEAAQAQLEQMRDIYRNSEAAQWAYSRDFDPDNPEHVRRLERMLEKEIRMPIQDWTEDFYFYDQQGNRKLRKVGRSEKDRSDDPGVVQWEVQEGGPRVLITPNDPETNQPWTGERRRDNLMHETNAVKLVKTRQGGTEETGYHVNTGRSRDFQPQSGFSWVNDEGEETKLAQTHMMDIYSKNPGLVEDTYADAAVQEAFDEAPTQEIIR
ncbi:MAG: RHS repeat-associated core domain-containing protein [Pseudomonadota bacterium]